MFVFKYIYMCVYIHTYIDNFVTIISVCMCMCVYIYVHVYTHQVYILQSFSVPNCQLKLLVHAKRHEKERMGGFICRTLGHSRKAIQTYLKGNSAKK